MAPSATEPVDAGRNGAENSALEPIAICGMACRLPGQVNSDSTFWQLLVEKRTGQTPKVPESRFNIDAHYHERLDRPGSFNVPGGYFLDGRPEDFDPTFFNITPVEAQWLDPQQRKILEVCYESLVSAGVTMEAIAGSNTAVFVGSFTADYQQMSTRDTDFRHNYAATGVDPGIISNRIGHMFNLRGPSFTINTACSSSVYAIHNACHALRMRDCDAAITGGVNLILTVDQHMNTAKLGILSPTSTCHTFDASADGYGRAEGAGALFLKRLSDAIRDGDPVRGVIRSTAVNTNGKIDGMGITHPSIEGQERVIRMAYEKANLDPRLTVYAELHGTGTPVGDPIEVEAVARAMNDSRPESKPLLVGALKPNIGHSEAASGIFAVMKAALMTEAAVIPGVALFERLNPNIKEQEWNVRVHANTQPWPQDSFVRRASVSSFGYGGTNGHVIVESVDNLYPWYQHGQPKKLASYDHSCKVPLLLCLSAHDKATLTRNIEAVSAVASEYYVADLAHTLNLHRTMFSNRSFVVARDGHVDEAFSHASQQTGLLPKRPTTNIGFLFTGQGAQWAGMFKHALLDYPIVLDTIARLDRVLAKVTPPPGFKIADLLLGEGADIESRINDADVAQPLCTATQIAIVDLLAQWDVTPTVSVGHSSGEIGAAYASGLLSAPEAIIAAFCRGRAVSEASESGSMMAVGVGAAQVAELLPDDPSKVCIACENSPSSVTLSGRAEEISRLGAELTAKGIFARELRTGRAYHSPHMSAVGDLYDEILFEALGVLTEADRDWRQPGSAMVSSVTGQLITSEALPQEYWSANLRQRVRFSEAVQRVCRDKRFNAVTAMVEIGPHSALSSPFKQICIANKTTHLNYVPSLVRNKNDTEQLLSLAGCLFLTGYPVNLEEVNAEGYRGASGLSIAQKWIRKPKTQYLLVDLPPYQWNYAKRYWAEPRASIEQRTSNQTRHDLLGRRVPGLSERSKLWRNVLRHRDVPWLKDHSLGGTAIFPAAGYLSIATEALRQVLESNKYSSFDAVTLRDVDIMKALALPDGDNGDGAVETVVALTDPETPSSSWYGFSVESYMDGAWTLHCTGKIAARYKPLAAACQPDDETALNQRVRKGTWYEAFDRVGFNYSGSFQQLQAVRTGRGLHRAAGDVTVRENSGVMQGESRSMIHPSTVDACLQLIIVSIHAGKHKGMPWGVVPLRIGEVSLAVPEASDLNHDGRATAWTDGFEGRLFNTHAHLTGVSGKELVDIKDLTCISYEAAVPAAAMTAHRTTEPTPFSMVTWKPYVASLRDEQVSRLWPEESDTVSLMTNIAELVLHRQAIGSVLVVPGPQIPPQTLDHLLNLLPETCRITLTALGSESNTVDDTLASLKARSRITTLPELPSQSRETAESYDMVLASLSKGSESVSFEVLAPLARPEGWILGFSHEPIIRSVPANSISVDHHIAAQIPTDGAKDMTKVNGTNGTNGTGRTESSVHHHQNADRITLLKASLNEASDQADGFRGLAEVLTSLGNKVCSKQISEFDPREDGRVVIDDSRGNLLLCLDEATFAGIQAIFSSSTPSLWLTRGVREAKQAAGGMLDGFLRVIRSEQVTAKIALLDVGLDENVRDVGRVVVDQLDNVAIRDSGRDTEFWLHHGVLRVPRISANHQLNSDCNGTSSSTGASLDEKVLSRGVPLVAKSMGDAVVFTPEQSEEERMTGEITLQALAFCPRASQEATSLAVGEVVDTGDAAHGQELAGKLVIASAPDHSLRTVFNASQYAVIDETLAKSFSPELLVHYLRPLSRLTDFLGGPHKLDAGSHVVLLPGPLPLVNAMRLLSKSRGWDMTVVTNQPAEKAPLDFGRILPSDDVEGVLDEIRLGQERRKAYAVIAFNFDTLGQDVWRCLKGTSRFYSVSESTHQEMTAPDALPFVRGASFIPISHCSLDTSRLQLSVDMLKLIGENSAILEDDGTRTVDIADLTASSLVHQKQPVIILEDKTTRFTPSSTYVLVGCLGGLGRSLTQWMMQRGARHFAFLSRSGTDKPEAALVVEQIEQQGGRTYVYRVDAADEEAVRRAVLELQKDRPIRGVVHAAMVLRDAMFERMSHEAFMAVIKPKANGALSLHRALQDVDLDFFVMTSSISAVLGNPGQANYSAANSFLDALALERNASGQVATSLALPMVLDVGVVAESDALETSLRRKGLYGIDEEEMLRGFDFAMRPKPGSGPSSSQMLMGLDAGELARNVQAGGSDAYWFKDARICHLRAALEAGAALNSQGQASGGDEGFATAVATAMSSAEGWPVGLEIIAKHIARRVASILMLRVDDIELDERSIASYGLDSMIGAEMRTWLFKEFALDFPFQKLLAPTLTIMNLAAVAAASMGYQP
ncbi:polyketide synthase [Colletotrichum kahawae]|uniref:Polyketide synthase n=1 Tax=Colletotrichum kahawae TaxID=34407 RepID=A0AAD9YPZ6_COLKA|nr:polyketide synthase [Colletotrichum kahawae]